jgi:hypothetical protein
MPKDKKFFEHIITVRVLVDRDIGEIAGPNSLTEVMAQCHNGDFVGELVYHEPREVTAVHMAELLLAAGSAPDFFMIDDAQSLANTLCDSASTEGCTPDLVVVSRQAYNELMEGVGLHGQVLETEDDDD